MTVREATPSPEHQKLVGDLVKWTAEEEFEVRCANYNGYEPCNTLKEHKPDARGYRADVELWCVGEAKTANDIGSDHTRAQFREFANRQMTNGKSKGHRMSFLHHHPRGL